MIEEFEKFLRLKFDERNQNMFKAFTQEKQKYNARGLLNSSGTVVAMHVVAKNELIECKNVIISTAFDVIDHLKLIPKTNQIEKICVPALKNRKREIEGIFSANINHIVSGLQNTKMLDVSGGAKMYQIGRFENASQKWELKAVTGGCHQLPVTA